MLLEVILSCNIIWRKVIAIAELADAGVVDRGWVRHLRLEGAHLEALALRLLRACVEALGALDLVNIPGLPGIAVVVVSGLLRGRLGLTDIAPFVDKVGLRGRGRCSSGALAVVGPVGLPALADG